MDGKFPSLTADYCRQTCGGVRCASCPQPRLLPDCQAGVAAYMTVSTQWRAGFGGRYGLDYTACIATLELHWKRWRKSAAFAGRSLGDVLEDVQIIERAMLDADAEKRDEEEAARNT